MSRDLHARQRFTKSTAKAAATALAMRYERLRSGAAVAAGSTLAPGHVHHTSCKRQLDSFKQFTLKASCPELVEQCGAASGSLLCHETSEEMKLLALQPNAVTWTVLSSLISGQHRRTRKQNQTHTHTHRQRAIYTGAAFLRHLLRRRPATRCVRLFVFPKFSENNLCQSRVKLCNHSELCPKGSALFASLGRGVAVGPFNSQRAGASRSGRGSICHPEKPYGYDCRDEHDYKTVIFTVLTFLIAQILWY